MKLFPEELFSGLTKTITRSNGHVIVEFDESRKKGFATKVISRNDASDFSHFGSLITEIERIRKL